MTITENRCLHPSRPAYYWWGNRNLHHIPQSTLSAEPNTTSGEGRVVDVVTFYKNHGLRITDQWLVIDDRRYPLRDLGDVRTTRGPMNRFAMRAIGTGGSLLVFAVLLGPAMPVAMTALLGVAGLGALGTGFVATLIHPREHAVWIRLHDVEVRLFRTTDAIELGKLLRSLRRALEYDSRFLVS